MNNMRHQGMGQRNETNDEEEEKGGHQPNQQQYYDSGVLSPQNGGQQLQQSSTGNFINLGQPNVERYDAVFKKRKQSYTEKHN